MAVLTENESAIGKVRKDRDEDTDNENMDNENMDNENMDNENMDNEIKFSRITEKFLKLESELKKHGENVEETFINSFQQRIDINEIKCQLHILKENRTKENCCGVKKVIFDSHGIDGSEIHEGYVNECFKKISDYIDDGIFKRKFQEQNIYFGATYNPERRFKEHSRKQILVRGKENIISPLPFVHMNVLYQTGKMENAIDMETRLINRYFYARNVGKTSMGLLMNKSAYFVYVLKYIL